MVRLIPLRGDIEVLDDASTMMYAMSFNMDFARYPSSHVVVEKFLAFVYGSLRSWCICADILDCVGCVNSVFR